MPYGVVLGVFMGSGLGLGTSRSSHALWGDPGCVYGVRVGFGDTWGHPMPYGIVLGVFMG